MGSHKEPLLRQWSSGGLMPLQSLLGGAARRVHPGEPIGWLSGILLRCPLNWARCVHHSQPS